MSRRSLKRVEYKPSPSLDFWMVIFLVALMIGVCFMMIWITRDISTAHTYGVI